MGHLNRERFGEAGHNKEYPDYEFERRGVPRPDMGNSKDLARLEQGEGGAWLRDGDAGKGNGVPDERMQRFPRRNGYDGRGTPSGPRPAGPDGQGYSRPSGPGRGGGFPGSHSVDPDGRGRGEVRGRRLDPRIVDGPDGRGHRIGLGSEGGEGRGYRMESQSREGGGRGLRMDGRVMGSEGGRGLGPSDGRGLGPAVRGSALDSRAARPDSAGLGGDGRGSRLDRGPGGEVGGRGSWQNEEEEEYVWDDMKPPQGRDPEARVLDGKVDDWYAGARDREMGKAGSFGRPGTDSVVGGLDDWRRVGSGPPADQFSGSAGMRAALRRVGLFPWTGAIGPFVEVMQDGLFCSVNMFGDGVVWEGVTSSCAACEDL